MNALRALSLAVTVGAYGTIVLGGYVSASGAGLACPDWPTCHGSLVPAFDRPGVAVEWTHRLLAVIVGVLVVVFLSLVLRKHRERRALVALSSVSFALLVFQTLIGMLTVGSALDAAIVTLHLGTAVAFFALVVLTTALVWWPIRGPAGG